MCDIVSIQELMLYELELGHHEMEVIKNICCAKGKGAVDHNTVTKYFQKFCSGYKNFNNETWSGRLKTIDSESVLQAHWVKSSE